ncbi:hypothetical protein J3R30DRAFT_3430471 [Lentinula aciculospora]|uniref:Zn(2)-C6 fungal-type domain-containing protein n=1 Tax=Lentinula aciculospora TaxID=153920 RepID=A0A9W9AS04_9AGAR|nr:hypothetical protein J3R30DRAFT_3430471 [Lentinula aciculospora]
MSQFNSPLFPAVRGHACATCRKRKIRCSGTKPVCTECESANAADECEYIGKTERTKASILQDEIDRLQARVRELERDQAGPVLLHQPYGQSSSGSLSPSSAHITERLIDTFLENAHELCFFSNTARFRAWVKSSAQHIAPPPKALSSLVYLWGAHLSQDSTLRQLEEQLFARVLQQTAIISSANRPDNFLYNLQTECLLARYLFSTGKMLEGRYHISRALSIGVGSGINKIRSNQPPPPRYAAISLLPPTASGIEEGERILCCWNGFMLDKSWASTLDTSSDMICPAEIPGAQTDTPWPQDEELERFKGCRFLPEGYSFTTLNFLRGTPTADLGNSTQAMLAKAIFCWERACNLAKDSWILPSEQYSEFLIDHDQRRRCISRFMSTLTTPGFEDSTRPRGMRRLKAHSIAHAANIQILRLNPIFEENEDAARAQTRSMVSSAEEIMRLLVSPLLGAFQYIDSVMGSVWKLAYQVLAEEVVRLKLEDQQQWQRISDLLESLQNGML